MRKARYKTRPLKSSRSEASASFGAYSGIVPILAIICEGLGLHLFWSGTIKEIITYPVIPRNTTVGIAIVASLVTALVSCVFLICVIPARMHNHPGRAAMWAAFTTVGLLVSFRLRTVATADIARVCPDYFYEEFGDIGMSRRPTAVVAACSAYHDTIDTAQPWGEIFLVLAIMLAVGVILRNLLRAGERSA